MGKLFFSKYTAIVEQVGSVIDISSALPINYLFAHSPAAKH